MKALSLHQPWATAVAIGIKRFETRSWPTRYRGPLAIHATRAKTSSQRDYFDQIVRSVPSIAAAFVDNLAFDWDDFDRLPRGAIIATVDVVTCMPSDLIRPKSNLSLNEQLLGNFAPGRWAWKVGIPVHFDQPIPCRGWQGLWNVPGEILSQFPLCALRASVVKRKEP